MSYQIKPPTHTLMVTGIMAWIIADCHLQSRRDSPPSVVDVEVRVPGHTCHISDIRGLSLLGAEPRRQC